MAYLLVHQSWSPTLELVLLILASCSLYCSGMVLNDVFDFEIDKRNRPNRPLPAGLISRHTARQVGFGLLLTGIVIAFYAGWIANHNMPITTNSPFVRTGFVAVLLAVFIFLYDGPLKRSRLAPFLMGGCRSLNILLGASTFAGTAVLASEPTGMNLILGFPVIAVWVALAIGILVAGVTLLGRNEASDTQIRIPLVGGATLIAIGLTAIALVAYCPAPFEVSKQQQTIFPMFIAIVSLTIARRVVEAIATAKPKQIQRGVISVLRSLIIFDASLCYLVSPDQLFYALAVLGLLIPTLLMARFIPST